MKGRRGNPGLCGKLLDKSVEAYILALETINRLSIQYRVETFTYLICNAWELLLKARILDQTKQKGSIYYIRQRGEKQRTLALRDCLKKEFPNEHDPIRRNIERIADLRDEAVHLVISDVPKNVLELFQACVLNYHKHLFGWFDVSLADRVSPGMMSIVYDFSPEEVDIQSPVLRKKLGKDAADYLTEYQARLQQDAEELGNPSTFSIGIGYSLALTKKPADADITLSSRASGTNTKLVEVPKDPSKTHPHLQKGVIARVNTELGGEKVLNQYDIQCVVKVFGVKKRPEHFYQGSVSGSPGQYSGAFVEWLIQQFNKDNDFFLKVRQKDRMMRKKAREGKA
jgi:hypothetical protein